MGKAPSKFNEPLSSSLSPLWTVDRKFCSDKSVKLRMREKVFSYTGDDFKVTDVDTQEVWFRIGGRLVTMHNTKVLYDSSGKAVVNVKDTIGALVMNYTVYRGEDTSECLFTVKPKITFVKAKVYVDVVNRESGDTVRITLEGDTFAKRACIYIGEKDNAVAIAKIYRPDDARSIMLGTDEYCLEVAANIDASICVILTLCLDEMKREMAERQNQ